MKRISILFFTLFTFSHLSAYDQPEMTELYNLEQSYMKDALKEPSKVKSLLLFGDDGSVDLFRKNYAQLKSLQVLQVYADDCKSLDSIFPKLKSVVFLRLNQCKLISLPKSIVKMQQLKFVNFAGNNLKEFPYELAELPNLTDLTLGDGITGGNPFTTINEQIAKFTQIKSLCLYQCKLDSISPIFCTLTQLEYFNVMQGSLRSLPDDFGKLTNLSEVLLNRNNFSSYPTQLNNLTQLQVLYLTLPDISIDYSVFSNFIELKNLSISVKGQKNIPESVLSLQNLEEVSFSYCSSINVKKLVLDLKKLPRLKSADLYFNDFSKKQKEYIRKQLPKIEFYF